MKTLIKIYVCALSVVVLVWATEHSLKGGRRVPISIANVLRHIAALPRSILAIAKYLMDRSNKSEKIVMTEKYKATTNLGFPHGVYSGMLIVPHTLISGDDCIKLVDLANGRATNIYQEVNLRTHKTTQLDIGSNKYIQPELLNSHRIQHPNIVDQRRVVYMNQYNCLVMADLVENQILWEIKGAFHHSIEVDHEGFLWVCASGKPGQVWGNTGGTGNRNFEYEDNYVVKIDKNGVIQGCKSVTAILCKNRLEYLLDGVSNRYLNHDPVHLNQVTPVLETRRGLKSGEIILSLRNLSTLLIVNFDSEEVKWTSTGPWMNQHCVQILDNGLLSVLDNHAAPDNRWGPWLDESWESCVYLVDVNENTKTRMDMRFGNNQRLRIAAEGRAYVFKSGEMIVEDSMDGTLIFYDSNKNVSIWSNSHSYGKNGILSWCRPVEKLKVDPRFWP